MGKTSSSVKNKYNSKVYAQINLKLNKELVGNWEEQLKKDGLSRAEFVRNAITEYLKKVEE